MSEWGPGPVRCITLGGAWPDCGVAFTGAWSRVRGPALSGTRATQSLSLPGSYLEQPHP